MAKKAQKYWKQQVSDLKKPIPVVTYCARAFPILGSKTAVQKAIAGGRLLRNGRKVALTEMIDNGDLLELQGSGIQKARTFEIDLEIIYEDDWLILINKPAGIAVNGNRNKTVENAVAGLAAASPQADALPRPVAVHRIDVPTRGLVLLAKTKSALIRMGEAFQKNQVKKEYVAVVHGQPLPQGRIDLAVAGKKAVTDFQTVTVVTSQVFKYLALVRLMPLTGRTHQLRIHLQKRGHLIVGDKMYAAKQETILGKGLFLCACKLQFIHPETGKPLVFQIDPPDRFTRLLEREQERF